MRVLLVGCGNMGRLLLRSWDEECTVVQPSLEGKEEFPDVHFVKSPGEVEDADVVVFAVKPQVLPSIIDEYKRFKAAEFITIAAGLKAEWYGRPIARVMPNVAMEVGKSTHMAFATEGVNRNVVERLFKPTGRVYWVSEDTLDILAPIVGSGPAYFFLMAEGLIKEAVSRGVDKALATQLVTEAFQGSAELAEGNDYKRLRESVTSKGGVTEAAIKVLAPAIDEAMESAQKRNKELSK